MFDLLMSLIGPLAKDIQPGRMLESVVLLAFIWSKLKPHLKKIEDRLLGLEIAVQTGFNLGETRFKNIETRLHALEDKPLRGQNEKFSSV